MHRTLSAAGAFWLAAFTYFIWGFTFLASRIAQDYGTPFVLLFWRFALAFVLLNLLRLTGRFPVRLRGRRLWPVLLAGLFEPVLYFPCEQYGLKLTSTSFSGVMVALIPLCSLVYGAAFLHEKATWQQVVFSVLSVARSTPPSFSFSKPPASARGASSAFSSCSARSLPARAT